MSTLVAQTISNGSVSTSSANVIQGSAKAWVNFNGTTGPTIRASYNVSSVTRQSTGAYTINFTNAFADTNYTANVTGNDGYGCMAQTFTTTSLVIGCWATSGVFRDQGICSVTCIR